MVGRLIASDGLPASLMSTPNSKISVGIKSSPPATPKAGHDTDREPSNDTSDGEENALEQQHPITGSIVAEEKHGRDRDEQDDDAVQGLGLQACSPARAQPSAEQAAGEQVQDHDPMRGDGIERHRLRPEWQG